MFGSKLDIFKREWLDVVFDGKNKSYGAYELRKENSGTTTKALIIACAAFILLFFAPKIISMIKGSLPEEDTKFKETVVELTPPPAVDKEKPLPPPPVEPPPPKVDQVKLPPLVVVPAKQVKDQEEVTVKDLETKETGQKTIKGDPTAEVRIEEPVGEGPKNAEVVDDNKVYNFASIEQYPEYPGGNEKFGKFLEKSMKYPPMARENNIQGKVFVQFVVEKDGSLTDIKVARGIGGGCDEEAVRVLRSSIKWKPGVQNGKPVRVMYTIPIAFTLQGQ